MSAIDTVSAVVNDSLSFDMLVNNTTTLVENAKTLIDNTDTITLSWSWGGAFKVLVIASYIATVIGMIFIIKEIRDSRVSKDCQRKVILDLIRHFYINNVIMHALYLKMEGRMDKVRIADGLFDMFAVLDSDLNLELFRVDSKDFEKIHRCCLSLRNYNITVRNAERSFKDPGCTIGVKLNAMCEIYSRSEHLTDALLEISDVRKLDVRKYVGRYVADYTAMETDGRELKDMVVLENMDWIVTDNVYLKYVDEESYKKFVELKYSRLKLLTFEGEEVRD